MTLLAAGGLTPGLLLKIVVSAWVAGIGVTIAFSALLYCVDQADRLHRGGRQPAAWAFGGAGAVAALACVGLVAYGLITVISK